MKKTWIAAAAIVATSLITLTGCGSDAAGDAEKNSGKLILATAGLSPNAIPSYLAEAKGYFKDHGVNVEIVTIEPGTDIAQLSAGDADLVLGGVSAGVLNAVSAGVDLKWVAPGYEINPETGMGMYLRSKFFDSSGNLDPKRLKGATLAISAPGGLQDTTILKAIAGTGVEYKDLNIQKMGAADIFAAVESGKVDGGFLVPPFYASLKSKDYKLGMKPILPSYAAYVAGPTASDKKDEITDFFCAIKDIQNDYLKPGYEKDPDSLKELTSLLDLPAETFTGDPAPNVFDAELQMDGAEDYVKQLQEILIPTGFLQYDKPVDPAKFIDREFIEASCS